MKTLEYFKKRRDEMIKEASEDFPAWRRTSRQYKKLQDEMIANNLYILYMETMPTREFQEKELKRLNDRMTAIDLGVKPIDQFLSVDGWKKAKLKYYQTMKVPELKDKINALKYLLSD